MTDIDSPTTFQAMVVPHSKAAEEAFLGSLLIDPEMIRRVNVEPEEFYIERHAWIYRAMQELIRCGQQPDYVTVCARLDEQKRLGEVGGPAYVMSLVNAAPTSLNAEYYAEIIQERARRRTMITTAQKLAVSAYDLASDMNNAVSTAMDQLARSVVTNKGAVHISKYIDRVYDEVDQAMKNPQDIYGIPTGFIDWDKTTNGLQKGEKVLLSGEPGVGKSVLGAQILINAAKCGHACAMYELEMSGMQVVRRVLSGESQIPTQTMRQGKLTDEEVPVFTHTVEKMADLPIYISEASDLTTAEIRADLMRLKDYFNVEVVMIDYEGLLGDAMEKDFVQRSTIISKRVHDIAKDLHLAVIAISDMTKLGITGEKKGQGAVAGSARALHDADQIILIRKTENQPNLVTLTWEKMREGESDRIISLVKLSNYPMFKDATPPARRI